MKSNAFFALPLLLVLGVSPAVAQEFTLISTEENTRMNRVTLDRPELNGNPLAVIIATPLGDTPTLNPNPVGAWYYNDKWHINNTNGSRFIPGLRYKIQYFSRPGPRQFVHVVTDDNLGREGSYVDHPLLNDNPKAEFAILQNHGPRPLYNLNNHVATASYNSASGNWLIANINGKPI
jgi:hypothetical protein